MEDSEWEFRVAKNTAMARTGDGLPRPRLVQITRTDTWKGPRLVCPQYWGPGVERGQPRSQQPSGLRVLNIKRSLTTFTSRDHEKASFSSCAFTVSRSRPDCWEAKG